MNTTTRYGNSEDRFIRTLQNINGGYPISKFGTGRFLLLGTFPHLFNLSYNDENRRYLRKSIQKNRESDFRAVMSSLDDFLYMNYGFGFESLPEIIEKSSQLESFMPSSEGEFLKFLTSKGEFRPNYARGLDSVTRSYIEQIIRGEINIEAIAKTPVHMMVFNRDMLCSEDSSYITGSSSTCNHPFKYIIGRGKSFESMALKKMEKARKIFAPTREELLELSSDKKKPVSKEELKDFFLGYVLQSLSSGEDWHKYFVENPPVKSELNIKDFKGRFGGKKIQELVGDIVFIDSSGVMLVTNTNEQMKSIVGKLRASYQNRRFQELPHKSEDNFSSSKKDSSIVFGYRGINASDYGEVRVLTYKSLLEGEFGSTNLKAHPSLKNERAKGLRETITSKSKSMRSSRQDLEEVMHNLITLFKLPDNFLEVYW